MIFAFDHDARREVAEAAAYYAARASSAGEDFEAEFQAALERIKDRPNAWPPILKSPGFRRCLLSRFPYQLIYRVEGELIRVYAVAHHKQRPGYWKKRVPR